MRSEVIAYILLIICFFKVNCNTTDNGTFMYFAYGSNLYAKRIHLQNPSAVFYSIAKLEDFRLDFNMNVASWNGAVATIVEDPGEIVWGDLWTLDISQMQNLDGQEGVALDWYFARNVTVTTPDGKTVLARTYQETKNPPKLAEGEKLPAERQPSNTYLGVIILGALRSHLPMNYIKYLSSIPTNGKFATKNRTLELGFPFDSAYACNKTV